MADQVCPACGRGTLARCGRRGMLERYLLPKFGLFPWRCPRCRKRFRLNDRGPVTVKVPHAVQQAINITPTES